MNIESRIMNYGIVLTLAIFLFPHFVNADTIINPEQADITASQTWTLSGSPYIINSSVEIRSGATLVIEPGVVLKFNNNSELSVYGGKIMAQGTEAQPIYLTSNYDDEVGGNTDDEVFCVDEMDEEGNILGQICESFDWGDPLTNDWEGMYFDHSTGSKLQNVFLRYARNSIVLYSSSANFENLNISNSRVGIDGFNNSQAEIIGGTFDNLGGSAVTFFNSSSITLDKVTLSDIFDFSGSVVVFNDSNLSIKNSSFKTCEINSCVVAFDGSDYATTPSTVTIDKTVFESGPNSAFITFGSSNINTIIKNSSFQNFDFYSIQNFSAYPVNAENNWWGSPIGPSDSIYGNVDFTPWLSADPNLAVPSCCSSVLFIPGFMASDLYVQGSIFENKLWPPTSLLKSDIDKLMLDFSGNSITPGIYTKSPISEAFGFNIYKSFIEKMDEMVGNEEIEEWQGFPYDWRKNIPKVVNENTIIKVGNNFENKKLIDEAIALAERSPTKKITIIGHSNGGLVGKELIKELVDQGKGNIVDQFVMVATPQIGTPKAVAGLLHGDQQVILKGLLLDKITARQLGYNMQSAYNLLPTQSYFSLISDPVIKFEDSVNQVFNYLANGFPQSISSHSGMFNFLTSSNRGITSGDPTNVPSILRSDLASNANANVSALANWSIPSNIKVFEIAGWGEETIKGIDYKSKQDNVCSAQGGLYICQPQSVWDRKLLMTNDGDGTVMLPSSTNYNTPNEYYLNLFSFNNTTSFNLKHYNILESPSALDFISEITKNTVNNNSLPTYISTQKPISTNQNLQLSVHSPISLGVFDSHGKYTGISSTTPTDAFTFIREEIPNSYYLEIGTDKYIGVPKNGNYIINLQGEGVGTFTLNQEIVEEGNILSSKNFIDIPVTPLTKATLNFSDGNLPNTLSLDTDGNGVSDIQIQSKAEFDPISYLKVMRLVIKTFDLKKSQEKILVQKIDNLIKLIEKGKIQQASTRARLQVSKLNVWLTRTKSKPHKQLTQEEIKIMIQNLEDLINNLK